MHRDRCGRCGAGTRAFACRRGFACAYACARTFVSTYSSACIIAGDNRFV